MIQTVAGVAFWVACNVLYYVGIIALLAKNPPRTNARIGGIGAFIVGPFLLLLPAAQLLFVVPLFTVFSMHGFTIPNRLPLKTVGVAIGVTILSIGLMIAVAKWIESASN